MKRSLSHTVWECHIVWVPKKRCKIIYGKPRNELRIILKRLCKYKSVEVIEGSMCIDHIHICLAIPPKYPSINHRRVAQRQKRNDYVRKITSAKWIKNV